MNKLICRFTNGMIVKEVVFKAIEKMMCLEMAARYQAKHQYACLGMKYM